MFKNKVVVTLDCNIRLNSYDIYLEILFAGMIIFDAFIVSLNSSQVDVRM